MRIITGKARGTSLVTLPGDQTRPTSEKAKEAIFSMLQFELEGRRVLDLFSGSGQMALEALSRGAESATLVDKSKEAIEIIRKNALKTHLADQCQIICADYADVLARNPGEKFDIVFLDPPYASHAIAPALRLLLKKDRLTPFSMIVCESAEDDIFFDPELANRFEVMKNAKYGIAFVKILRLKN